MRIIFETATGSIRDFVSGTVVKLAEGLQVVNLPDYSGDQTESNIENVTGGSEARAQISAILGRLSDQIDELNGKYPGLAVAISDTEAAAGLKMIAAGVTWADHDTYAGRLKNLKNMLNGVR